MTWSARTARGRVGLRRGGRWRAGRLKTAYVRVRLCGADRPSGIRYIRLYGTYQVQERCAAGHYVPLEVRREGRCSTAKSFAAGMSRYTYTIETGKDVRNEKVAFAVPATR